MNASYDAASGRYLVSVEAPIVAMKARADVEIVTVKHGSLYYVARVFVSGTDRYPQHWNEAKTLSSAAIIADDLARL